MIRSRVAAWAARTHRGRVVRYGTPALALLMLILIGLCVPFYAGSTLLDSGRGTGANALAWHVSWRLEHARMTVNFRTGVYTTVSRRDPLWVAMNNEGLKWWPEGAWSGPGNWSITVPLWMVLVPLTGISVWSWRSWRRVQRVGDGACVRCGYARAGLAEHVPCPECGTMP